MATPGERGQQPHTQAAAPEVSPASDDPPGVSTFSLTRIFSAFAGLQLVLALSGLVRNKVTATTIGPSGFGEYSQLLAFAALLIALSTVGLSLSLSRAVAAAADDVERQRSLTRTATTTVAILTTVAAAVVLQGLLAGWLLRALSLPDTPAVRWSVVAICLGLPIMALQGVFLGVLQALLDANGIARYRGIAVVVGTAVSVVAVLALGLLGATVGMVISGGLVTLALALRMRQMSLPVTQLGLRRTDLGALIGIGAASSLAGVVTAFGETITRGAVLADLGASVTGRWQAAFALSAIVQGLFVASIGAVSVAILARSTTADGRQDRVTQLSAFASPLAVLALAGVGLCGPWLLATLYSPDFTDAASLLPFILVYHFTTIYAWIVGAPLLGANHKVAWLALELLGAALRYGLAVALLSRHGAAGVVLGMATGASLHLLATVATTRWMLSVRLTAPRLAEYALGCIAIIFVTSARDGGRPLLAAALVVLAVYSLRSLSVVRSNL